MMIGKKRMRRKSSDNPNKKMYFGPEVTTAISSFNKIIEEKDRLMLYNNTISPALMKLAENLILIYGFSEPGENISEIQTDCVAFLYENLRKFDSSRGTKAFSYFNVIARNWLIQNARKKTTYSNRSISIDDTSIMSTKDKQIISHYSVVESPDDLMIYDERKEYIKEVLRKISKRLIDENEKTCMQAIMTIFDHVDDIDILHKRAIFVYIRDISNLNQKQLSIALSAIRRHYKEIVILENSK